MKSDNNRMTEALAALADAEAFLSDCMQTGSIPPENPIAPMSKDDRRTVCEFAQYLRQLIAKYEGHAATLFCEVASRKPWIASQVGRSVEILEKETNKLICIFCPPVKWGEDWAWIVGGNGDGILFSTAAGCHCESPFAPACPWPAPPS
jgi:hypothetical protein